MAAVAHATELSPHANRGCVVEAVAAQRWSFEASPNGNFHELWVLLYRLSRIVLLFVHISCSWSKGGIQSALNEDDDGVFSPQGSLGMGSLLELM